MESIEAIPQVPGKILLEQVTPRSPLRNPIVEQRPSLPSAKRMWPPVQVQEELAQPQCRTLHHRFLDHSATELKHKQILLDQPDAFKKKRGKCQDYVIAASQCDRMQPWIPGHQRASSKESRLATATEEVFQSLRCTGRATTSSSTIRSSISNHSDGFFSSSLNSFGSTPLDTLSGSQSGIFPPRPYLIDSLSSISPYDIDDDMSITTHLSGASALRERHTASRLTRITQFQQAFDQLKINSKVDKENLRKSKQWKPRNYIPVNEKDAIEFKNEVSLDVLC
jgi:hypothetical protein